MVEDLVDLIAAGEGREGGEEVGEDFYIYT